MSRIIVTAQLLTDLHRAGKTIVLPRNALVTPAARDWMRENPVPIEWQEPTTDAQATGQLLAVIDLTAAMHRSLLSALERGLGTIDTIDPSEKAGGIVAATTKLSQRVADGSTKRGLVFTDDAPLACCVANKHRSVRAIVAQSPADVEQAVRQFAPNVLVVAPAQQTVFEVKQMVDRFVRTRPGDTARPALEAIVALEGVGHAHR
jgi:ribose 5-phosphate isomerase RpiB